jgi:putative membrane protein
MGASKGGLGMNFRNMATKAFTHWVLVTMTILMAPYLIPGISIDGPGAALAAAAVLGLLNVLVKPVVILFTLPLTILTLGLFLFVINALMLLLTQYIVKGFVFTGFWPAFFLSILISLVTSIMGRPLTKDGGFSFSFRQGARGKKSRASESGEGVVDLNERDGKWQ